MAFAYLRGYKIETLGGTTDMSQWVWSDTKKSVLDNPRPCRFCGREPLPIESKTGWGVDACIGVLPNVLAACCGHGDRSRATLLTETYAYTGEEAWQKIQQIKNGRLAESG